jgi:hypothetical protein
MRPPVDVGSLERVPVPALLFLCYQSGVSGVLSCTHEDVTRFIHFNHGGIVFADSSRETEQFLVQLLERELIIPEEMESVKNCTEKTNIRVDTALLRLGILQADELAGLILEHTTMIVCSIFEWTAGSYGLEPCEPQAEQIELPSSTTDFILEGIRRLNDLQLIRQWLGNMRRRLNVTTNPLLLYQFVTLNSQEGFIVSRIESETSIEEILSMDGMSEEERLRAVCGLVAIGMLEAVEDEEVNEDTSPTLLMESLLSYSDTEPQTQEIDFSTMAAFCYEVETKLRSLENLDAYNVLEINRQVSDEEVAEAYKKIEKKYHPEGHSELLKYNPNLRGDLEKIIDVAADAYELLNSKEKRSSYNLMWRTGQFKSLRED